MAKKSSKNGMMGGFLPNKTTLTRWSDMAKPSPAAVKFARTHNMWAILGATIFSFIVLAAGIAHVVKEPTNPAVWLIMYLYGTPLYLTLYWELYLDEHPRDKKWIHFYYFLGTILWTTLSLAILSVIPQIQGWITAIVWGTAIALFWGITGVGVDLSFDGILREQIVRGYKAARKHVKTATGR